MPLDGRGPFNPAPQPASRGAVFLLVLALSAGGWALALYAMALWGVV